MRTIADVVIGEKFHHPKHGGGMVSGKTKRTITITFENGLVSKNTYRYADAYFYITEF